jgi:hypothetical protein
MAACALAAPAADARVGLGRDVVLADATDVVARDCETVRR